MLKVFLLFLCFVYGQSKEVTLFHATEEIAKKTYSYEGDDVITLRGCGIGSAYWGDRIVGGSEVSIVSYPWQVSLRLIRRGSHYCGGTLLNTRFVITAAHCVKDMRANAISIVMGSTTLKSTSRNTRTSNVRQIHVHPKYSTVNLNDDIAILELDSNLTEAKNLQFPFIRSVCLPKPGEEFSGMATVTGWGRTSESTYGSSDSLRAVDVELMTDEACRSDYGKSKIYDSMLCAGYKDGGKDACQGDSGGPLVKMIDNRAVLLGVVSWGYGCARPRNPGVYTQVSDYIDWIDGIVRGIPAPIAKPPSSSWGWFPWKTKPNGTMTPPDMELTTIHDMETTTQVINVT